MEEKGKALLRNEARIVARVLRHFSARDIHRMARVCRTWRKSAATILKERSRVATMTAEKPDQSIKEMAIMDYSDAKNFLWNLDIECGLAITFQVSRSSYYPCDRPAGNCEAISSCLPPSFTFIGVSSKKGIIGTSTNGSLYEQQISKDRLSAYLFPKSLLQGALIKPFSMASMHAMRLSNANVNMATLEQAFKWPSDQTIKCIIMLGTYYVPKFDLVSRIQASCESELAFAGGIADEVYSTDHSAEAKQWSFEMPAGYCNPFSRDSPVYYGGLVFGGEHVRATSMIIAEKTEEAVENRLKELKAVVGGWSQYKQKIAFMFASSNYKETVRPNDVATRIFHQLMPGIPVNGMLCGAAFGWNYAPPVALQPAKRQAKKRKRSIDALLYETTTVAVIGFV